MRRGFGLTEVLVAVAVMAGAFLPLFSALTAARDEATDASEFLELLDAVDERASAEALADSVTVERGPRHLSLRTPHADALAAIAPLREAAR